VFAGIADVTPAIYRNRDGHSVHSRLRPLTPDSRQLLKDMVEINRGLAGGSASDRVFTGTSTMAGTSITFAGGDRGTELELDRRFASASALRHLIDERAGRLSFSRLMRAGMRREDGRRDG
jgi:hypothetical protein